MLNKAAIYNTYIVSIMIPLRRENRRFLKPKINIITLNNTATGILNTIVCRSIVKGLINAEFFKVPPAVIGLSMIALGTSLPELCTTIISSRKQHSEIALGNVVGASILDLLLVLGVSALIN